MVDAAARRYDELCRPYTCAIDHQEQIRVPSAPLGVKKSPKKRSYK